LVTNVINERHQELRDLAWYLDDRSRWNIFGPSLSKVVLVLLGSLCAAKAAADQLLGASTKGDILLFAGVGVLSAVVAGVMAAFQFDARASALALLAAEADSAWRRADTLIARGANPNDVLDQQDASLNEIKDRAAKLGINTVLNLRKKRGAGIEASRASSLPDSTKTG
jgi:hypothetical protein